MIDKTNITVLIADDHPMILKGLHDELIENNYNVVGQAVNGKQARDLILALNPTIALLDIDMPVLNGFEVIKNVKEEEEVDTKFIVLSFHRENDYIAQARTLQINGYLLKEDSFAEIEHCIENVLNGQICFSKSFEPGSLKVVSEELKKITNLTPSEKTILKFIAEQVTSVEIAEKLCISKRTVEKHRSNISIKLEIATNTYNALAIWAYHHKNAIKDI